MLNTAKGRRWWEGPLAKINNRDELEAWLRKQPREVAVAFAARAAFRVLPLLQNARSVNFRGDFVADIVLPVFRATGVAWVQGVRENTPAVFEPNVADTMQKTAQPIPEISPVDLEAPKSNIEQPVPPPEPLGEVDPEKSRRFMLVSEFNSLWKVFLLGDSIGKAVDGWSKAKATLGPFAAQLIEYLRSTLPGGGN